MKSGTEGTWLSEPLRGLRRLTGSLEGGWMSKPRTIWVPRLRRMQRPAVSEDVASLLAALEQGLHEVGPRLNSIFSMLEWQTGQRRSTLFIIMITLLCVYMVIGENAPFVCNLITYLIAAYSSFHNIESSTKNDDSRWIVFWVIFGLFGMMDHFTDQIREHFPLFWLFKLLFLTWCLAPTSTNGVTTIYFHLLYPLFLGVNDPCITVPNFGDGQEVCSSIWRRCYPWALPTSEEEQLLDAGKGTGPPSEEPSADKKPAGDSKAQASVSASSTPLGQAGTEKQKKEKMMPKKGQAVASDSKSKGKGTAGATSEKNKKQGIKNPSSKAQSSISVTSKKAATPVNRPSPSASEDELQPSGTTTRAIPTLSGPPSQAPTRSASDSVIKSKTGTQDGNEDTYESHLSSNRGSKSVKNEQAAAVSSWNDISVFSKRGEDIERRPLHDEERIGSVSSLLGNKSSSIPVIQPVVQPLFSLHSSPYSSTYGPAHNAPFPSQPPAGPYAFGPSCPSYHAGPFYPRHPLGYNRARMLLYNGPMQKQKSLGAKKLLSPDESEGESFIEDPRPAGKAKMGDHDNAGGKPGQPKDAKCSLSKEEVKKATGEDKAEDKKKPAG